MTIEEKIELLADAFDLDAEEITPDMELDEMEDWNSLTKLSIIVMFDDEFNKKITSDDIKKFTTIDYILKTME